MKTHHADDETLEYIASLEQRNARLVELLKPFSNLDIADHGRMSINAWRDDFINSAPEYIGYCKAARAFLAKTKE
jgi:hypothetical protein